MTPITVVIVDDHRVVSRSLKAYLESFPDIRVAGIAANGEELLQHLAEWKPQIVIQDLLLPGGMDGIETTRRVRAVMPSAKVIALTASTDEARMAGVIRAGASGYLRKDADPEVLLVAVRAVARGGTYIDPRAASSLLHADAIALTDREMDILRQVALGHSNKEIAAALSISEQTVKTHVASVFGKLEVQNRTQALVEALKRGLISAEELQ